ncbi:MAG: DUF2784 domain-containing protein [Candidatus Accumulibacter sp.]|uniref:DUF2784 domain-containing protein n=1 Tax=Accumulibacter sp. TaxID=2053492 RepID=UPI001A435E76|nr:DUF2784 domain-containing protein [Accumulibacter sp.]MBL8396302.1 DUF2784 domain-containing protein [Accumulibacter sp.]
MIYRLLADGVVLAHFLFIAFVGAGGLLVLRWPRLAVLHLPAACWGVLIELTGWICPLTPVENELRQAAGETGYQGSFIAHHLLPLIYPAGFTRGMQLALAAAVIAVNLTLYAWLLWRLRAASRTPGSHPTSPGHFERR